jgi:hypothetical protein
MNLAAGEQQQPHDKQQDQKAQYPAPVISRPRTEAIASEADDQQKDDENQDEHGKYLSNI